MARPFDPFLWHESPHGREDQDESWSSADDNEAPFLCYQVALEHASVKRTRLVSSRGDRVDQVRQRSAAQSNNLGTLSSWRQEGDMDLALHEKRYVIIGNGVAGTTAAETLRKNDPTCSIHLLTNEPYPLYNRV